MIVEVLGVGNLFTPQITNTSFLLTPPEKEYGKKKFLIDCGYNVFQKLVSGKYDIENIATVIITHTHPDHVGSLGALIYYRYFMFNKVTNVAFGFKCRTNVLKYLESTVFNVGQKENIRKDVYDFSPYRMVHCENFPTLFTMFEVQHSGIPAYGVHLNKEKITFTGDTDLLNPWSYVMANSNLIFHDCLIDYYARGTHSYIKDMESYPTAIREKIRLVHHGKNNFTSKVLNNGMTLCCEGYTYLHK